MPPWFDITQSTCHKKQRYRGEHDSSSQCTVTQASKVSWCSLAAGFPNHGRGGGGEVGRRYTVYHVSWAKAEAAADSFTVCVADPPTAGCILLVRCTLITPLLRCDSRSRYVRPHTTGSCTTTTATPSPALAWKVPGNPSHARTLQPNYIARSLRCVPDVPWANAASGNPPPGRRLQALYRSIYSYVAAWEGASGPGRRTPLALLQSELRISQSAR